MTNKKIVPAIVGHRGKMGAMLMADWQQAGYSPLGLDRIAQPDATLGYAIQELKQLATADVVIVCVPVLALQESLAAIVPYMRQGQVLMDVTSVKVQPLAWMQSAYAGAVIGTHPLFGPKHTLADRRVTLVAGTHATAQHKQWVERLFADIGCTTFYATAQEHDRGVGFAQSLNFAVCASFFATLARQPDIRPFLTPSFRRIMDASRKHLTEDTAMFCEFSKANPYFADIIQEYQQVLEQTTQDLDHIAEEAAVWYSQ